MRQRTGSLLPIFLASSVAVGACSSDSAGQGEAPSAVPIAQEPRHRVVFESPLARVFVVQVLPGDTTLFHVHADQHAGVVISGSARWGQTLGQPGEVYGGDPVGALTENSASALPYTHRVANLDSVTFHYVMGQFLGTPGIESQPLPDTPFMTLEMETPRGRVYRIRLLPGEEVPAHRHAQPGLSIEVGEGTVVWVGDAVAASSPDAGAGAWWWREAGHSHAIRNAGDTVVEFVEIDWK